MEDDKLEEEKISENKQTDSVMGKLHKLDNTTGPEIKTKKRLKSQGSDTTVIPDLTSPQNTDDKQPNPIVVNSTKKGDKPRKIKITQLSKKAKPTNIIGLSTGINAYRNDHEQGWEFLRMCSAEELAALLEKKDMDVELIVGVFKIMNSQSTSNEYE